MVGRCKPPDRDFWEIREIHSKDGYQGVSQTSRITVIFEIRANWINSFSKIQKFLKAINFPTSYGRPKLAAKPKKSLWPLWGPRFIAIYQLYQGIATKNCPDTSIIVETFCGTPIYIHFPTPELVISHSTCIYNS